MSVHPLNCFSQNRFYWNSYGRIILALVFLSGISGIAYSESEVELGISEYSKTDEAHRKLRQEKKSTESTSTTDHSKLKELEGPFSSGPEVTKACLECHNKAGQQFMKNKHWTWDYKHPKTGQHLGKSVLVNNFCTNARGNEGMCAQCHAGYNMTDSN